MQLELILLAGFIILLAGIIKGFSGFATALFAVPLLSLFLDIKFVIIVFAFLGLIGNSYIIIQAFRYINKKILLLVIFGILIGTFIGTYFLIIFKSIILKKILSVVIIIFALKILLEKKRKIIKKIRRIWGSIAGFFGGIFAATFSTGGLPVAIYLAHEIDDKKVFRATIGGGILYYSNMENYFIRI